MDKRSSKRPKKEHDFAITAFRVAQEAIGAGEEAEPEPEQPTTPEETPGKNPNAVALGRLGGKKGGKARADKLTPERRREIARKAAATRWGSNV